MSVTEKMQFSKITTAFLGIIGLVGTIVTIYAFFFQNQFLNLQYEIIANTNVLDINANITKLDILYNEKSLKQKNENLRIINLKIVNNGTENILNNYYDPIDPLGFSINNGYLIEVPELLDASNEYLKNNLKINVDSTGRVHFSQIIIENNEYFILKILLLHNIQDNPTIIPSGKIAGIKRINVLNKIEVLEKRSFISEVFSGDILVQVGKSVIYFLIVVGLIIISVLFGEKISSLRDSYRRKKVLKKFIEQSSIRYNKMDESIFERFKKDGSWIIDAMNEMTLSNDNLNNKYAVNKKIEKERIKKLKNVDVTHSPIREDVFRRNLIFDKMLSDGLVFKHESNLQINKPMKETLEKFTTFLKLEGVIKETKEDESDLFITT